MSHNYQILRRPLLLTEKGTRMREGFNKYLFEVSRDANKEDIRSAVEQQFPGVHVENVRTMVVRGRQRRMGRGYAMTQNWKKAIVTLRQGEKIEYFEPGE